MKKKTITIEIIISLIVIVLVLLICLKPKNSPIGEKSNRQITNNRDVSLSIKERTTYWIAVEFEIGC